MPGERPANPKITKQVMEQYEKLRRSNTVNMRDMFDVYSKAGDMKLYDLMNFLGKDLQRWSKSDNPSAYLEILTRYDFYMKKYKLRR